MSETAHIRVRPQASVTAVRLEVSGAVQGIGFRPFVYRLARKLELRGWTANGAAGVVIEIEGAPGRLERFAASIATSAPDGARIDAIGRQALEPSGCTSFEIRDSLPAAQSCNEVVPDRALCAECREELFEPGNARYRYPFISCAACGPRYSVVRTLPYDRSGTSMSEFTTCTRCHGEYTDPNTRRFHAQTTCCPICGPQVSLWDKQGTPVATRDDALQAARAALLDGAIVAVKGIGGFHLMADATNYAAIARLRRLKQRPRKPLAVMFPTLEAVATACALDATERELLQSPAAPIVLLRQKPDPALAVAAIAPGSDFLGVMLPYSPLHALLTHDAARPLIATSGNRSGEPLCTDERTVVDHLAPIADWFLVHNRPIVRALDDSIARIACGRPLLLRRARGYVPQPFLLPAPIPPILARGAHLKNTVAFGTGRRAWLSQHIGDLDTAAALSRHSGTLRELPAEHGVAPVAFAKDHHPDYASNTVVPDAAGPSIEVQHHYAHVLACMADNGVVAPVLGVAWDGAGAGTDGTLWGGEFLRIDAQGYTRLAHLRAFSLPGGATAMREPRRAALALLWEWGERDVLAMRNSCASVRAFDDVELRILLKMLERNVNSPRTTSAGRLFDAISSLLDQCQRADYEGEAAMKLESLAARAQADAPYRFVRRAGADGSPAILDWAPMIADVLDDIASGTLPGVIAARFHLTLATMIAEVAADAGCEQVVLTGGCFQNALLLERSVSALSAIGIQPYWHRDCPPNDGGLALGQLVAAGRALAGHRQENAAQAGTAAAPAVGAR